MILFILFYFVKRILWLHSTTYLSKLFWSADLLLKRNAMLGMGVGGDEVINQPTRALFSVRLIGKKRSNARERVLFTSLRGLEIKICIPSRKFRYSSEHKFPFEAEAVLEYTVFVVCYFSYFFCALQDEIKQE